MTTRTATTPHTRVDGARLLPQLDSRHTSDAVDILRAVLADPAAPSWPVIQAASALAALEAEYATEALLALHAVAANSEVRQHDRYLATRAIEELESSN